MSRLNEVCEELLGFKNYGGYSPIMFERVKECHILLGNVVSELHRLSEGGVLNYLSRSTLEDLQRHYDTLSIRLKFDESKIVKNGIGVRDFMNRLRDEADILLHELHIVRGVLAGISRSLKAQHSRG